MSPECKDPAPITVCPSEKFPIGSNKEKSPGRKLLLMVPVSFIRLIIFKGQWICLGANHHQNDQLTPGAIKNNCVVSVALALRETECTKTSD